MPASYSDARERSKAVLPMRGGLVRLDARIISSCESETGGAICFTRDRRDLRLVITTALLEFVSGRVLFDDPYAGFTVGEVDENAEQTTATILAGDPQVISREALINGRMRELDHLKVLIDRGLKLRQAASGCP